MTKEYEQYEKDCKVIRAENKVLLAEFSKWLSDKNFSTATIKKHCGNIDFYINEFLLYEEATRATEGVDSVGMFLGYWFIRKAMWSSQSAIKENAASLKKFYQFMLKKRQIDKESFEILKQTIKEEMPEWLATVKRYDDPTIDDPAEIWGL